MIDFGRYRQRFMKGNMVERWAMLYVLTEYYHKKGVQVVPTKALAESFYVPEHTPANFKRIIRYHIHQMKRLGFVTTERMVGSSKAGPVVELCVRCSYDHLRLS